MSHTAEPWRVEGNKLIEGPTPGFGIGSVYASSFGADTAEMEANARRIVSAVNACAGIPTEALEAGVVGDLLIEAKKIGMHARLDDLHPKDFQRLRIIVIKTKGESP